jgi:hypothetical protein
MIHFSCHSSMLRLLFISILFSIMLSYLIPSEHQSCLCFQHIGASMHYFTNTQYPSPPLLSIKCHFTKLLLFESYKWYATELLSFRSLSIKFYVIVIGSDFDFFRHLFLLWHPQMQLYPWMYDRVADHNSSPFPRFCTIQITPFSPVRAPQACHCLLTLTPNSPFFGTCPSSSSLSLDFDFDNVVTCFGMEGMFSYWHCVIAVSSSRLEIPTAN